MRAPGRVAGGGPLPTVESVQADLGRALGRAFAALPGGDAARAHVPRVRSGSLAGLPDSAILPGPDMMATVLVPVKAGAIGIAAVSFAPEDALQLIRLWAEGSAAERACADGHPDALEVYRAGARALARAGLDALGFEPADASVLEEDALIATLLRTHAPPDTKILSAELAIELEDAAPRGVFLVLADAKALGPLRDAQSPSSRAGTEAGPRREM